MQSVTVTVPASTSNLGSGFDTLGMALRLYNQLRVRPIAGEGVVLTGKAGSGSKPGELTLAVEAAELFFHRARKSPIAFEVALRSGVPAARGLGYSATIRTGVLAALNALTGERLSRHHLLQLATELEGHPDNASPSILGGFTVSGRVEGEVRCLNSPVRASLKLVTLIPGFAVATERARRLLPSRYARADAAHGLNRAALITAALTSGDYASLQGLFDDRIHQPYRRELVPRLDSVIRAGERAGAIGGFLSGSGSSIICVALRNAERVAAAMRRAMPGATVKVLSVDNHGFRIRRGK